MKKKRSLIIALGTLAVISMLYVFLTLSEKKPAENQNIESIDVINRDDISYIEVKPKDQEAFTIEIHKSETKAISVRGYGDSYKFNEILLYKLAGSLEGLKAYEIIEGSEDEYGISDDSPEVILNFEDNTKLTLRFGSETIIPGKVYMQVKERGEIFVIRKDIKDICNSSLYRFRIPQLLPMDFFVKEGNIFKNLEVRSDGSSIVIRPQTSEEKGLNKSDAPSVYVIEEPFWECSDGKVYSQVLAPILSIEDGALVAEDFPQDLSAYGITEDSSFFKLNIEDYQIHIIFGNETEDGYVYAMSNGLPSIAKVPESSLAMMELEWFDLINTSLIARSIDKIKSFTLDTSDKNYEIELLRDKEGRLKGGLVNGISIDESSLRDIYMKLLNIHIEGKNPNGEPDLRPVYKVNLNLLDGISESIEFTQIDTRVYSISKNGKEIGFYTGFAGIKDFIGSLEALD